MAAADLTDVLSLYPILSTLSRYISALDLYHLALTSKDYRTYIQPGSTAFSVLCRESLCDGSGMTTRQEYMEPFYHSPNIRKMTPTRPRVQYDDQIEVNVWASRCG